MVLIKDAVGGKKPEVSAEEKKAATKRLWLGGLCCGAALAVASNFQQLGITAGTDAGKAGFLTALYVVLVPVFGLFFGRKVSVPVWIAVGLSVVSLYLLCIKGSFSLAPGDILILVCALCFAVHILVIDRVGAGCDGFRLSFVQFLFAGIISTIFMFIFDTIDISAILSCALPLLYVGIFSCGVGYAVRAAAMLRAGLFDEDLAEIRATYGKCAAETGTLWEDMKYGSSIDHGFSSFIAVVIEKCLGRNSDLSLYGEKK